MTPRNGQKKSRGGRARLILALLPVLVVGEAPARGGVERDEGASGKQDLGVSGPTPSRNLQPCPAIARAMYLWEALSRTLSDGLRNQRWRAENPGRASISDEVLSAVRVIHTYQPIPASPLGGCDVVPT